ncbi:Na+/H+ antiporter NhaC family protein [Clostridium autoethanogenum]|uniref:Na+/H+ antiporter NhaC family protein n=1 Tax=Clostridium autoethanogenum TaxID=84023 RepID=A0A3M0SP13_9CLOT|nr:Na+/H+ antiporter NhaC family protein [Clostridium autoethanogenum]RMD00237.1 Na+/H+ antiporter NhaC family protein [Clostridium autoethanogenum]
MNQGLISLFIPIIVIILSMITKRIIAALVIGILTGGILLAGGNIINGCILAVEHLVKTAANKENVYIIMFLFLFGAFGEIMKLSGGIKGFSELANKYVKTEKGALGTVWLVTIFTFIDCCFHGIAAGTVGKALIEKVKGSKDKLAVVLNVTSCLLIILIPFGTTYVGYIIGVINSSLNKSGLRTSPYSLYLKSIPFNFYAITMILISIGIILFNLKFNDIVSKYNNEKENKESDHGHEAHEQCEFEEKAPPRPFNLIIPLVILIAATFFFFWYTGKGKDQGFMGAIINAEFEKSILLSGVVSVIITTIFYLIQKIPMEEIESHFLSGGNEMMPPIIVLTLSWGLSSIIEDLGFVKFITNSIGPRVPAIFIPVVIFLIGCAVSYFMGSAWGTWALLMPIAIPIAVTTKMDLPLVIGAVLAGGSLGDNASPLGETAILSSTITDVPLMKHVKTMLPYSIASIIVSSILFIVFSFVV